MIVIMVLNCGFRPQFHGFRGLQNRITIAVVAAFVCNFSQY